MVEVHTRYMASSLSATVELAGYCAAPPCCTCHSVTFIALASVARRLHIPLLLATAPDLPLYPIVPCVPLSCLFHLAHCMKSVCAAWVNCTQIWVKCTQIRVRFTQIWVKRTRPAPAHAATLFASNSKASSSQPVCLKINTQFQWHFPHKRFVVHEASCTF